MKLCQQKFQDLANRFRKIFPHLSLPVLQLPQICLNKFKHLDVGHKKSPSGDNVIKYFQNKPLAFGTLDPYPCCPYPVRCCLLSFLGGHFNTVPNVHIFRSSYTRSTNLIYSMNSAFLTMFCLTFGPSMITFAKAAETSTLLVSMSVALTLRCVVN